MTELHNGGEIPRRAQSWHGRDMSPLLIYLSRIDAPAEQVPVHPWVLAFLTTDFLQASVSKESCLPSSTAWLSWRTLPSNTHLPGGRSLP